MDILILSTTSGNNFELGKKIQKTLDGLDLKHQLVSLEDYNLPLYTSSLEKDGIPSKVEELSRLVLQAKSLVILCPEYNGSVAPILVNALTWISCVGEDWRAGFNHKFCVIGSHSGGGGTKVCLAMRQIFEHLGSIVYPRAIVTGNKKPYNEVSSLDIFTRVEKLIRE